MIEPKRLRVLDLRDSPWFDGPGRTILEVAEGLRARGVDIVIGSFVSDPDHEHAYLAEAGRRGLTTVAITETKAFDPNVTHQIKQYCRDNAIDLIHGHELRSNLYGLWAARSLRVPVVATAHGWIANDLRGTVYTAMDKFLLRFCDGVITVSKLIKGQLRRVGLPERKLTVVQNTLPTADYVADPADRAFRDELGVVDDTLVLGKIGRLSAEKDQALLFRALRRVVDAGIDAVLVLVGIGPDEEALRALAAELGLADRVFFLGFRKDMHCIYNGLDLVVQSSYTEGMPNVILEAMAMQVPVVATAVGGTPELIDDGVHGLLAPPRDANALAERLQTALRDPEARSRMAAAARERVEREFDSAVRLDRMAAFYQRLGAMESGHAV